MCLGGEEASLVLCKPRQAGPLQSACTHGGWPVARVAMHHPHIKERALRDDTDADFELGVSLASLSSARAAAGAAPRASTPPDPWDPRSLTPPVPTELEAAPTSANGAPYSYEDPIPLPPQHRRQMGTRGPVLVMMKPVPTRRTERPRTADAAELLLREIEETQAVEAELAALEAREQAAKEESQLLREIEETHAVEAPVRDVRIGHGLVEIRGLVRARRHQGAPHDGLGGAGRRRGRGRRARGGRGGLRRREGCCECQPNSLDRSLFGRSRRRLGVKPNFPNLKQGCMGCAVKVKQGRPPTRI